MYKPSSTLPALVTPSIEDGKTVDEETLRNLVNRCIELDAHNVGPGGTMGESVNRTNEEKKNVTEILVDEVNGNVPVVAGTGTSRTDQTVQMRSMQETSARCGTLFARSLKTGKRG